MGSEVTKYSVYDPRIIQTKPKYAVEKGALSISNVSFQAQTWDSSSVQFNVQVPSENVFVDRAIELTGTIAATVTVTAGATFASGSSLVGLVGPAAFPLHQATTQMTSTINDATVTVNTQDVLPQVLRLADMRDARRQRTCPTMLDRYATYPDTNSVSNSPLGLWDKTFNSDEVPNAGYNGFYYATDATGKTPQPLSGSGTAFGKVGYVNGLPVTNAQVNVGDVLTFHVAIESTEKLMLPPFIFNDQYELSTGLFGVQNFQVQLNLAPSSTARSFRVATSLNPYVVSSGAPTTAAFSTPTVTWASNSTGGLWVSNPTLAVQFLTPALDVPLPPKSIVPYMEFPRYIATPATPVPKTTATYAVTALQSQTITLPNIPDLLLIFVKPQKYADASNGDWALPIVKISLNFDNFSGLLSTMTQQQLYQMSVHNGVDMDWSEWSGYSAIKASSNGSGGNVGLVGGPLVLRPGRDFPLQSGQSCGLVGNFTLQFNIDVQNFTGIDFDGSTNPNVNIYTVPISSGFFETIKGSSRIIKGVLTEQDILSAPASAPSAELERPVGAARPPSVIGRVAKSAVRNAMSAYV